MNLREVIGGRCSVISKSGIRYVGTLVSIESEQKTLSFENGTPPICTKLIFSHLLWLGGPHREWPRGPAQQQYL